MKRLLHHRRFTLLELLLVVFILAAVAATAASLGTQVDEQFRYDDTKARREEIRRAIIGDPSRTANGQPIVSGFAADMGRLPASLQELVEPPTSLWLPPVPDTTPATPDQYCQGAGWRGPYLRSDTERDPVTMLERRVYRDGYRNLELGTDAPGNFGWVFSRTGTGPELTVSLHGRGSDGRDDVVPPSGPFSSAWDQPLDVPARALAVPNDYLVDLAGWSVHLRNAQSAGTIASGSQVRVRLYFPQVAEDGSGALTWGSRTSDPVTVPEDLEPGDSTSTPVTLTFVAEPDRVPWGVRSVVVIDEPATPESRLGPVRPVTLLPNVLPSTVTLEISAPP